MADKTLIEQLLIDAGIVDHSKLEECLELQKKTNKELLPILVEKELITTEKCDEILRLHTALSTGNLESYGIREEVLNLLPDKFCRENSVIPVERIGKVIIVATDNPSYVDFLEEIQFRTGLKTKAVMVSTEPLARAIDQYYGRKGEGKAVSEPGEGTLEGFNLKFGGGPEGAAVVDEEADLPASRQIVEKPEIVTLINLILGDAIKQGASHIHFEPMDYGLLVRYRIDGSLYEKMNLPKSMSVHIISRIKSLANCDLAERRLPQDGAITLQMKVETITKHVDMKVGILPTLLGERVVMTILDKEMLRLDLGSAGFPLQDQEKLRRAVGQPSGLILVTGPKGVGKKSTLYALLASLCGTEKCILTAEKPVTFVMPRIGQVQVKEEVGLTYEAALRTCVQQDPDVIMIQEICDQRVARLAVQAALDCCLVMSSLRAEEASASFRELIETGVQPTLAGSAVRLVLSQRLVRRLCKYCSLEYTPSTSQLENIRIPGLDSDGGMRKSESALKLYRSVGCEKCNGTGYRGRLLVYELLEVTEKIREAVSQNASKEEIKKIALEEGMETINQNAWRKVLDGVTSLEEYLRIAL